MRGYFCIGFINFMLKGKKLKRLYFFFFFHQMILKNYYTILNYFKNG